MAIVFFLGILILDQIAKLYVRLHFMPGESVTFLKLFLTIAVFLELEFLPATSLETPRKISLTVF